MLIGNFFGHLKTVLGHRHKVFINCCKAGIIWRGLTHDLSKFSPTEFIPGVKYYQGSRSPNEMERETIGFSKAWMHHKGRNRHHFEYWSDYSTDTKLLEPVRMPDVFIYEMFCDRVAASKIYNKKKYNNSIPLEYFMRGKNRRNVDQETSDMLEKLLVMLAEKGEDETFKYIRSAKKNKKTLDKK
ncbi:MAG: DUF5662 family protein [Ruminococcus sp.]|nr:DUF5662 family protein [Ruminococcus sp.]